MKRVPSKTPNLRFPISYTAGGVGGYKGHKYQNSQFAGYYAGKHEHTLARRISNWRERRIMAKALRCLAPFDSVLDLPSGTGRFFPVIASFETFLLAADRSADMLIAGQRYDMQLGVCPLRFVASAFGIPLPDNSVDVAFCARFIHHLPDSRGRIRLLREIARIARKGVVISFFDSDTFKHRRRQRKQRREGKIGNRHAITRDEMINEASQAGLNPLEFFALLPHYAELTALALRLES